MRRGQPESPLYPRKRTLAAEERLGLKKQTLDVRFTPKSGPNSTLRWMSAYDPKRTLMAAVSALLRNRAGTTVATGTTKKG